jgi:hypothetical protein
VVGRAASDFGVVTARKLGHDIDLFSSRLQRHFARHDHPDSCSSARTTVQIDPTTEAIGHDVVDDVQS